MKRSDMVRNLKYAIVEAEMKGLKEVEDVADFLLAQMEEAGMKPDKHIHPRAVQEGLDDPKWGYIRFIDKYPEHHFPRGRPYEYYVEGWEKEDE